MKKIISAIIVTAILAQSAVAVLAGGSSSGYGVIGQSGTIAGNRVAIVSEYGTDSEGYITSIESINSPADAEYIYIAQYDPASNKLLKLDKWDNAAVSITKGNKVKIIALKDDGITPVSNDPVEIIAPNQTAVPTIAPTATPTTEPTTGPTEEPTAVEKAKAELKDSGVDENNIYSIDWEDMFVFEDEEPVNPTPSIAPEATPTATPTVAPTATPTVEPSAMDKAESDLNELNLHHISKLHWNELLTGLFD